MGVSRKSLMGLRIKVPLKMHERTLQTQAVGNWFSNQVFDVKITRIFSKVFYELKYLLIS